MAQVWKAVAGYEELYQVSNDGRVKSLSNGKYKKEKMLKPGIRAKKYPFVVLCRNGLQEHLSVHRLVAQAFLPNPYDLPEVNHKDENPQNNSVDNLEWCTRQYNIEYSKARSIMQYTKDGQEIARYKSISAAAKSTGICRTAINNMLVGMSLIAGGYVWRYNS